MTARGEGPTAGELQLQVQHRLLEELRGRQEAFQTHLDLLQDVALRLDGQGALQMLNPAWSSLTGYPVEQCLGRPLSDFLASAAACESLQQQLRVNSSIDCELCLRASDGSQRQVLFSARRRGAWFCSMHDVTATREALAELDRSQSLARKLSLVASRTDNLVVITNARGEIEWVNAGFERVSGYTLDEVIGHCPGELLQGQDTQPEVVSQMARGLEQGKGFSVELINYSKQGRRYWVAIDCSPVHDDEGRLTNFVAIEREISSRKAAEAALQASENRYRQIITTVGEPIIRCDDRLSIQFANPAWLRLTGIKADEYQLYRLPELVHPEDREHLLGLHRKVQANGGPCKLDLRMVTHDCDWRRVELSMAMTATSAGQSRVHLTCAISDIQARWEAEQASLQAQLKAEELSSARTSFVANMSHEIRTPLNAIVGMVSVLERTPLTADQQVCLQTIRNGSQSLMALVGDILDLAKLDAGAVAIDEVEFSPLELFEEAVDMVASSVQDKGLSLALDCAPGLPRMARGDAMRIRQIVLNLLSNATKFTENGGLRVRLRWIQQAHGLGCLQFSVADSGIGVEPERLASLFDAFTQADVSTTRRFGGTGLGLSICRQICELLGGRIVARSAPGRGSVFSVRLPITALETQLDRPQGQLLGLNLDAGARRIATAVADWTGLPLRIEQEQSPSAQLVWQNDTLQTCLRLNEAVQTPLRVWRQLDQSGARREQKPQDHAVAENLSVLVAEDVTPNQVVIRAMLQQLGCRDVTIVDNGQKAVDWMAKHNADIVLLDLHMPVKDGLTAALEIRDQCNGRTPPIWAISADVTTEARHGDCQDAFDGWLTKPMTRDELAAVLQSLSAGPEPV